MRAWHFLYKNNKMRDKKVAPKDGVKLTYNDTPIMCQRGLHASIKPYDALQHAPGPILCLVECEGVVIPGDDKLVCTERTIIARMDAMEMLRYYARMQALKATQQWDAPQAVLEWLMTGGESYRSAARSAAEAAAWSAARSAAWSAAWSAAKSAAWSAARSEFDTLVYECFEGCL